MYSIRCEKEGFRPLPLQAQVSAFGQGDLGRQVMFPLAEGELSEKDHARATTLLAGVDEASQSGDDEETLKKLFELHEMMPTSTEIVFNIASTYDSLGDTEKCGQVLHAGRGRRTRSSHMMRGSSFAVSTAKPGGGATPRRR